MTFVMLQISLGLRCCASTLFVHGWCASQRGASWISINPLLGMQRNERDHLVFDQIHLTEPHARRQATCCSVWAVGQQLVLLWPPCWLCLHVIAGIVPLAYLWSSEKMRSPIQTFVMHSPNLTHMIWLGFASEEFILETSPFSRPRPFVFAVVLLRLFMGCLNATLMYTTPVKFYLVSCFPIYVSSIWLIANICNHLHFEAGWGGDTAEPNMSAYAVKAQDKRDAFSSLQDKQIVDTPPHGNSPSALFLRNTNQVQRSDGEGGNKANMKSRWRVSLCYHVVLVLSVFVSVTTFGFVGSLSRRCQISRAEIEDGASWPRFADQLAQPAGHHYLWCGREPDSAVQVNDLIKSTAPAKPNLLRAASSLVLLRCHDSYHEAPDTCKMSLSGHLAKSQFSQMIWTVNVNRVSLTFRKRAGQLQSYKTAQSLLVLEIFPRAHLIQMISKLHKGILPKKMVVVLWVIVFRCLVSTPASRRVGALTLWVTLLLRQTKECCAKNKNGGSAYLDRITLTTFPMHFTDIVYDPLGLSGSWALSSFLQGR